MAAKRQRLATPFSVLNSLSLNAFVSIFWILTFALLIVISQWSKNGKSIAGGGCIWYLTPDANQVRKEHSAQDWGLLTLHATVHLNCLVHSWPIQPCLETVGKVVVHPNVIEHYLCGIAEASNHMKLNIHICCTFANKKRCTWHWFCILLWCRIPLHALDKCTHFLTVRCVTFDSCCSLFLLIWHEKRNCLFISYLNLAPCRENGFASGAGRATFHIHIPKHIL